MKNRDRYILKVNEYDMLISMQRNTVNNNDDHADYCIIDALTGRINACPEEMVGKVGNKSRLAVCSKCIQKFLNEEG